MTPVPTIFSGLRTCGPLPEPLDWRRLHSNSLLDESVEELASPARRAPIEAEGELVQVGIQIRRGDRALVDTEEPAFEQGHDSVSAGQQVFSYLGLLPDDLVAVSEFAEPAISLPSICPHRATQFHSCLDRSLQRLRRGIGNLPQADASDAAPIDLGDDADQDLASGSATPLAWLGSAQERFVSLHRACEPISAGANHGDAQLVQPDPGGPVTAQPQDSLEPQGTDTRFLVCYVPHRTEPQPQIRLRVLEDRPSQDRRLETAGSAVIQATGGWPDARGLTSQTAGTFRPAQSDQIRPARLFGGKTPFKLHEGPWVVVHIPAYYRLGRLESSA